MQQRYEWIEPHNENAQAIDHLTTLYYVLERTLTLDCLPRFNGNTRDIAQLHHENQELRDHIAALSPTMLDCAKLHELETTIREMQQRIEAMDVQNQMIMLSFGTLGKTVESLQMQLNSVPETDEIEALRKESQQQLKALEKRMSVGHLAPATEADGQALSGKPLEHPKIPSETLFVAGVNLQELEHCLRAGMSHTQLVKHFHKSKSSIHRAKQKLLKNGRDTAEGK